MLNGLRLRLRLHRLLVRLLRLLRLLLYWLRLYRLLKRRLRRLLHKAVFGCNDLRKRTGRAVCSNTALFCSKA
ncbi:MAG: hypothetical protein R2912_05395 [Eubacteriales bacterium]